MESLPPLSALTASVAGLVACVAIYLGAQSKGWTKWMAILAGVAAILCISVLPHYLLVAFDNVVSDRFEIGFIGYLGVGAASVLASLAMSLRILWSRHRSRPN